jgi:hypothetical protein
VEKRRAARQLNSLLSGGEGGLPLDGRTEKRRKRLIKELVGGRRGTPLKPIDVVTHVNELLDIGETIPSLKKQGVKPRKTDLTEEVLEVVRWTQQAYEFRPEAWQMLGIDLKAIVKGGAPKRKKRSSRSG